MAALIIDQARAARMEARRVRTASLGLRVAIRRNSGARAKTEQAAAAEAAREAGRRAMRCGSPWSDLDWRRADYEIDRTLVPLD